MSTARKKIDMLNMRVEPTQKKLLEKAAEISGRSISAFVLEHALQAAHRELDEVRSYSLNLRDAKVFMAALESTPKANFALKSAFSGYEKKYTKTKR
jgi:uncharacterized protein (DUF1778 family)